MTDEELIALADKIGAAIEQMPYLDFTHDDEELDEFVPITLRHFYEGTWQGSNADQLFSDVRRTIYAALVAESGK